MLSARVDSFASLATGTRVRVRLSPRSPYSGRVGILASVDTADDKGPYLVRFEDGTQFRYNAEEIESTQSPRPQTRTQLFGRIMKTQLLALTVIFAFLLSACGPAPNPKLQGKSADTPEQAAAPAPVAEQQPAPAPVASLPAEEPKATPAAKPRREAPARETATRPVSRPRPAADANASATPAANTASNEPKSVTLPSPVGSPIAAPVPPPPDEVKAEAVAPPPAPKRVRVPSGTLVSVVMTDGVDSETASVGETFKATLEEPIVVDNETVFPKGSEVYVKLSKVQSAGRVSGKSEVQLELDRIFLDRTSYSTESSKYVSTGASQSGRTARSAGVGAAIGAAIGAISGGGKGAVIGGATGAGAGAGVEAIRKGEQVRVEPETRLQFRLEDSLDVTLDSPSSTSPQRNNPSGPRFRTRQ